MKYIIILLIFLLIPLVYAETTFFDNPDDAFIMGNSTTTSPTGEVIGGITEETTGSGGCLYKWNCTNWSECPTFGKQIRNCTNIGTCSNTYKSPEIKQNCTYTPPKGEKEKEIVNNNKIFLYFIIILIIGFIIFYLKKDCSKKLIKK